MLKPEEMLIMLIMLILVFEKMLKTGEMLIMLIMLIILGTLGWVWGEGPRGGPKVPKKFT